MLQKTLFGEWGWGINLPNGPLRTISKPLCGFLLAVFFFVGSVKVDGQSCIAINNCAASLKLEVVREFPNVSSTCSTNDFCGGGNQFYQIKYRVYLRYSAPTLPQQQLPFNLQYKSLKAVLKLEILGSASGGLSYIDTDATNTCYTTGPGANWPPQTVAFKINESSQTVDIDFMNGSSSPCGTGGDAILFNWGAPPGIPVAQCAPAGASCAYAELFSIVVNAYPGESIRVIPQVSEFIPFDSDVQQTCNPIMGENGNINNNGVANVTVASPINFANTINDRLLAEILAPILSNGKQKFELRVRNTGANLLTIKYLECVALLTQSSQDIEITFSGNNQPRPPVNIGNTRKIHYIVSMPSGLSLAGGASYTIGFIEASPPNPSNQPWSVELSLIDDTKSRVRSIPAGSMLSVCTSLPISLLPQNYNQAGLPTCTSSPLLKVQLKDGIFDPCGSSAAMIQVGFDQIDTSSQFNLSKFVFEMKFDLTSDLAIVGVNFDDWIPSWTCPAPIDNSCLPSGSDGTCYDIVGNDVIRFCFSELGSQPLTITGDGYINIVFNNAPGCITRAKVTYLEVTPYGEVPCIPIIDNALKNPSSSVCPPQIKGRVTTETNMGVEEVTIQITTDVSPVDCIQGAACTAPCALQSDLTDGLGYYGLCTCETCNCFVVTPSRDDNPLNGVTTYDLVLISKHILGLEPFDSPFKMIAADANKSGSITTFDIVSIRKLILGIFTGFDTINPTQKSWRFVPKNFAFPNAGNPFQTVFPEAETDVSGNGIRPVDFTGIKIGDVNNTVVANRPTDRPLIQLSWPATKAKVGGIVTIPIIYSGSEPLEAFQLGLRYDPAILQLLSPSQGDLPFYDTGSFNLAKAGEIRTLWLPMDIENPELHIEPGAVLFYLTFKVLAALPESGLSLSLDDAVLSNAAWKPDGTECAVGTVSSAVMREESSLQLQASIRPNPTASEATLHVQAIKAGKGRVALFDAFGRRLSMRDVLLDEGQQDIPLPEVAQLSAGVYLWKLYSSGVKAQGHLIKQ